jgi:hypothetical protein
MERFNLMSKSPARGRGSKRKLADATAPQVSVRRGGDEIIAGGRGLILKFAA